MGAGTQEVTAVWGVDPGQQVRLEWMELCAWWVRGRAWGNGSPVPAAGQSLGEQVPNARCRAEAGENGSPVPGAGQNLGGRVPVPAEEGDVAHSREVQSNGLQGAV